jgi:hypothetical protein
MDLLTDSDVAGRMKICTKTLRELLTKLSVDHPDTIFCRFVGRERRYTEDDYRNIVSALPTWRPAAEASPKPRDRSRAIPPAEDKVLRELGKLLAKKRRSSRLP